mgnify:CR=1 FL=1
MENFEFERIASNVYKLWLCKKMYDKTAVLNASYKNSDKAYLNLMLQMTHT